MIPERRRIKKSEIEVIRTALQRAPMAPVEGSADAAIPDLEVVARCECGCASVDFEAPISDRPPMILADATARTPRGGKVGVIIWGRSDAITGLEIYDQGAGDHDLVLPVPATILSWEETDVG